MKHISIRVPWHDNKWNGSVCNCPQNNPFCMMLRNISSAKDTKQEQKQAGMSWDQLGPDLLPACKGENGYRYILYFTFEDPSSDRILWEHLGMLDNPVYMVSWERKLSFYESIGYVEGNNLFTSMSVKMD